IHAFGAACRKSVRHCCNSSSSTKSATTITIEQTRYPRTSSASELVETISIANPAWRSCAANCAAALASESSSSTGRRISLFPELTELLQKSGKLEPEALLDLLRTGVDGPQCALGKSAIECQ